LHKIHKLLARLPVRVHMGCSVKKLAEFVCFL